MKKYVFEISYQVFKEVVVEADDFEEAQVKAEEGEGDVISEEGEDFEFACIKMPENLEEEK
jgi:hypothetical protein